MEGERRNKKNGAWRGKGSVSFLKRKGVVTSLILENKLQFDS